MKNNWRVQSAAVPVGPEDKTTKAPDPVAVDAYMKGLSHPLASLAGALRATILAADPAR